MKLKQSSPVVCGIVGALLGGAFGNNFGIIGFVLGAAIAAFSAAYASRVFGKGGFFLIGFLIAQVVSGFAAGVGLPSGLVVLLFLVVLGTTIYKILTSTKIPRLQGAVSAE